MTIMADECCDASKIVTAFLLNTCRSPPWPRQCDVEAASCCAALAGQHPLDDEEVERIPLITGSVAEFYIEPMLPLFGDIDVMFHLNTLLQVSSDWRADKASPSTIQLHTRQYIGPCLLSLVGKLCKQ